MKTVKIKQRTTNGRLRGRPPKGADEFFGDEMARELARQMATLSRESRRSVALACIWLEASKRGGLRITDRAVWLIEEWRRGLSAAGVDARQLPTQDGNYEAVRRWLRDPHASSLEKAMSSPRKKTKSALKPYAGKPR